MPITGLDEEYLDDLNKLEDEISDLQDLLVLDTISALEPEVPITMDERSSLARTIRQMNRHNIGCVLVTDEEDRLVGVFTEWDVLMRVVGIVDDLSQETIADYMTPEPIALKADLPIAQALNLMSVHGFRHLPLVDDNSHPTGIISFRGCGRVLERRFGRRVDLCNASSTCTLARARLMAKPVGSTNAQSQ